MTTTITAIRTALEATISGLTPVGTAYGRTAFVRSSEFISWDDKPESDIDREFSIGDVPPGDPMQFGIISEILYDTSFEITVGHAIPDDHYAGIARRDDDLTQIAQALNAKSNFPASVYLIRTASDPMIKIDGDFWITRIRFRIIYSRAV